jgi:hypothetical protein
MSRRPGFRDRIRGLLTVRDTPRRIAATFAAGIFIGISPLIGIHTLLGLLIAQAFGLNRFVMLSGVYITNPWSVVPIYTFCTWVGMLVLGVDYVLPEVDWHTVTASAVIHELRHVLMPFVVGTTIVGSAAAALSYIIMIKAARGVRASTDDK